MLGPLNAWLNRAKNRKDQPQAPLRKPLLSPLAACSLQAWQAAHGHPAPGPRQLDLVWAAADSGTEHGLCLQRHAAVTSAEAQLPTASDALQLEFPCVLRPAVRPGGLDLQLQLFRIRLGQPQEPAAAARSAGAMADGGSSSSGGSMVASQPRRQPRQRRQQQQKQPAELPPLLSVLDKAAALLAARLLFPDPVLPVLRLLAAAHCVSAATQAAGLLLSPAARSAARNRLQRLRQRAPAVDGAARAVCQLGSVAQRYGDPAAALLAAAALWAYLHPSSAQIGECIAALIPVLAGYNQTAKHCARLGLSGDASEELWRQRHKWAARRTAALLSDLPDTPPLAGLVSRWEVLNICIGAVVGGQHFGNIGSGSGSGSIAGATSGLQLCASLGLRSQQSRRQRQETLAVAAGHVAAAPASPLEDLEGGSAGSGSGSDEQPWEGQPVEQHDMVQHPGQQQGLPLPGEQRPAAAAVPQPQQPQQLHARWEEARRQWLGGEAEAAAGACSCAGGGRGVVCDSPSEMCCSPQGPAPGDSWASQRAQQAQAQEQQSGQPGQAAPQHLPAQGRQGERSSRFGGGRAPSGSSGAGAGSNGSSSNSNSSVGLRSLGGAEEATLREAAAAATSAAAAADFMHPANWAAVRQAQGGGALCGAAHGDSTSSVSGGSSSAHSFLLPGRCFSSSDASSEAGAAEALHAPSAAQLLPPGIAAPAAAAAAGAASAQQPGQQQEGPAAEGASAAAAAGSSSAGEGTAEAVLPLYGQGDHEASEARQLSTAERLQLAVRAVHLLALFLPFLLLGSLMLLLAVRLDSAAARRQQAGRQAAGTAAEGGGETPPAPAPTSPAASRLRTSAFKLLLGACRHSGAAFIKWGQWASTREDIFPQDFCRVLSELHDRAPIHTEHKTRRIVEAAFGRPLEQLFMSFEAQPLASGSIAQVHRARMLVDGQPQEVAVKVRHPGVGLRIWQDFQLLRPLAALTGRVRSLRSLNLSDSVAQFSHTMTAQADLRVEAAHLRRFYSNFRGVSSSVHVPRPLEGYCAEEVLVETFEPGRSVAHFIRSPHPQNTQIVALGVDTYLKMLLQDNFVHTDLHPGNILVRTTNHHHTEDSTGGTSSGSAGASASGTGGSDEGGAGAGGGAGPSSSARSSRGSRRRRPPPLELVLLDFGLAQECTARMRRHFISFLHNICRGDGRRAAHHLLQWAVRQRCPDPEAFTADMEALFRERCNIHSEEGIDLDAVIKAVLHLARRHEVSIDSNYAELVIGVCVIVGFATSLDRRVNLMDAASPVFLYHTLTGRVSGRLYM